MACPNRKTAAHLSRTPKGHNANGNLRMRYIHSIVLREQCHTHLRYQEQELSNGLQRPQPEDDLHTILPQ